MQLFFISSQNIAKAERWNFEFVNNMTLGHICDMISTLQDYNYNFEKIIASSQNKDNMRGIYNNIKIDDAYSVLYILLSGLEIDLPYETAICKFLKFSNDHIIEQRVTQLEKEKAELELEVLKNNNTSKLEDEVAFWKKMTMISVSLSIMSILYIVSYYLMSIKCMH